MPYRMTPEDRAARRERMKALHADPRFNPLAGLDEAHQLAVRALLRSGIDRATALAAVRDREEAT